MRSTRGAARLRIVAGVVGLFLVGAGSSSAAPTTASADAGHFGLRHFVIDSASYTVRPETGGPRSRFIATLRNTGLSTIEYGHGFGIAVRTDGRWRRLRHGPGCAFTDEALLIRPGESVSQRVGWLRSTCSYRALDPGLYRVSKTIRFTDPTLRPDREQIVRAFFRVEAD